MPVILATQKTETRRIYFKASPGKQFVRAFLEKTHYKKKGAVVVAQGIYRP
jgi:hypothetical protein